ncbi:hypothetical protein LSM04_009588 [Trypanosoma melophagium]|uniref:uncharacterized protein n=1 Tax=Trypanosoma melophagium TaxID=715481 RepID=UPI00351A29DE|nr:hypothetical protein LSM04_009588 [Trypanosoma melophagium]
MSLMVDEQDENSLAMEDPLLERLRAKHEQLRLSHLKQMQKSLDEEHSIAYAKMNKLPVSLDLCSDEITVALNEIGARCEEYHVPQVGQLLKDVRTMMNRQLREAYSYMEKGYKSAFHKLNEEAMEARRQRELAEQKEQYQQQQQQDGEKNDETIEESTIKQNLKKELGSFSGVLHQSTSDNKNQKKVNGPKLFSLREAFSVTTSFFAEMLAALLRCEVVRIYLYDEYENLVPSARFPVSAKKGDPMSGTDLELMLANEVHRTVCRKCIAVNGKEAQHLTISERDRELMEEELKQSGWKSMTSCLIFPILSNEGFGRSYGMIHAVNKQGVSYERPGVFDENDEVLMSVASRLLGSLLTRYPVKYFMLPVGNLIQNCVDSQLSKHVGKDHLPPLMVDEVEAAAEVGNKAIQMITPILVYRAPINAIYQSRTLRKKTRKLEVLNMIDKGLSTVEFNLVALEELWKTGHEENTVLYKHCQQLNEQVNTLQILLRNVLDGIGASRTINNTGELSNYLQMLELYARQENIPMIIEIISQVLLKARVDEKIPLESQNIEPRRLSPSEIIKMERRIAQTPSKLKFGAAEMPNVRTYLSDPDRRREQVRFVNKLAEQRAKDCESRNIPIRVSRYKSDTRATVAKKVNQQNTQLISFGPTDYASNRPFNLEK